MVYLPNQSMSKNIESGGVVSLNMIQHCFVKTVVGKENTQIISRTLT